jgi:hypothetical protein
MYLLNFYGVKNTFLRSPLYLLVQASAGCPASPVFFCLAKIQNLLFQIGGLIF